MKLNEFKEEIYKCSGCGLCQSVCPVFKILKTECAVSRGKFKLLNAIVNEDIKYSKKTLEIMDLCMHCQACSEFCPSGINAQKIIETAQYDMLQKGIFNLKKLCVAQIFENNFYLNLIKVAVEIIRMFKVLEFLSILNCKKIKLMNDFLKIKVRPSRKNSNIKKELKIVYFKGCINNYINPSSANAVKKVLDKTNVELIEPDFNCCGLPLKSVGDFDGFKKLIKKNLAQIPNDCDYVVFDCQSCKSTFLNYADFLDGADKEKALLIGQKTINIYELLEKINYLPKKQWKHQRVTCHYPCHTRFSDDKNIMTNLINKIPNITFVEAESANSCCGGAGSFIFTNENLSKQISKAKAEDIMKTDAQVVITSCPACFLGLKQGLIEQNSSIKVLQLIEFLAQ